MAQTQGLEAEPTGAAAEYLMMIRYMHGEGQPVIAARLAERSVGELVATGGDDADLDPLGWHAMGLGQ